MPFNEELHEVWLEQAPVHDPGFDSWYLKYLHNRVPFFHVQEPPFLNPLKTQIIHDVWQDGITLPRLQEYPGNIKLQHAYTIV